MSRSIHYTTAPEDRISILQKSAYALGALVNNLQAAALPAMVVILNLGLGMNPALVGLIGSIPRIFDAVSDPMMGYISDNTRSRFGRRKPYIFLGAIISGTIFALMWQLPPGQSESFYFWTFLTASIFFFLAYTVYATPFVAFGYEMTPDYHEKTRLQAFANWIGQIAWLTVPWFYAIMANESLFRDKVHGARTLAIWVGAFVAVFGIFPSLFCRERYASLLRDKTAKGFWKNMTAFFKGIGITFKCPPFLKLCAATFLVFNGFQLGASFSIYVMIYYVFSGAEGSDKQAGTLLGLFGTLTSICTLCIIPLVTKLSTKVGKRRAFLITIFLSIVGYALKWIGYNPDHPYWLLFAAPFVSCGIGSLFTLIGSMVADVCDYDELQTGQRREGMFGAIYWWMVKIGMSLAALLTGILLNVSGFNVAMETAQTVKTLFLLRIFDVWIPIVTSVIAIGVILTYEITEEKAHQIRLEIERRRGKAAL